MSRDFSIDALKSFAITLVVLGHLIQSSIPNFDSNYIFKSIYSFHMPLFIFISGYLSFQRVGLTRKYLKRRFLTLIVPYFSWMVLSSFFVSFTSNISFISQMLKILYHPDYGLWFLWVLFWMHIVLYFSSFVSRKHHLIILTSFAVLTLVIVLTIKLDNMFSVKTFAFLLPFFILGYFSNLFSSKIYFIYKSWFLFLPFFFILVLFWQRDGPLNLNFSFASSKIVIFIYKFIIAIIGIIISIGFFKQIRGFNHVFLYVGANSITIYILNFYCLSLFNSLNKYMFNSSLFYLYALFVSLIVICMCLIADRIIRGNRFTSLIFLGKVKL